jgi:hypothetical protein
MKATLTFVLLLTSLFFSACALAEGPTIEESSGCYRSGKVKYKVFIYRDENGHELKTVRETYRKNGSRKYNSVVLNGSISHYTKYTKEGLSLMEKIYQYNFNGILVSIETKRDGISSFQNFETDLFGEPINN